MPKKKKSKSSAFPTSAFGGEDLDFGGFPTSGGFGDAGGGFGDAGGGFGDVGGGFGNVGGGFDAWPGDSSGAESPFPAAPGFPAAHDFPVTTSDEASPAEWSGHDHHHGAAPTVGPGMPYDYPLDLDGDSPAQKARANSGRAQAMLAEISAIRASLKSLSQVNEKLQRDLQQRRKQVVFARHKVGQEEGLLGKNEDELSEIRGKLFQEKNLILDLEDKLRAQNAENEVVQTELHEIKAIDFATQTSLEQMQRIESHHPGDAAAYGHEFHRFRLKEEAPQVSRLDELSDAYRANQARPRRTGPVLLDTAKRAGPMLHHSSLPVWRRTPHLRGDPDALVARRPIASSDLVMETNLNYKSMLVRRRGILYRDDAVAVAMSVSVIRKSQPCIYFELTLANCLNRPLHAFRVKTDEGMEATSLQADGSSGGELRPRQQRRFRGRLEVLNFFEYGPQLLISYATQDNTTSHVCLKLPLSITRLLTPSTMEAPAFMQLWTSPELMRAEVSFVCTVSVDPRFGNEVTLTVAHKLELDGRLSWHHDVTEGPQVIALAGQYPMSEEGSGFVLVSAEVSPHSEFRGRTSDEMVPCRVSVRSKLQPLNRAIARTLLTVLSDY